MLIILTILFVIIIYVLTKYHYGKWQRLGIPYDEPAIPYGSLLKVRRKELHFALVLSDIYERFAAHRYVGIYLLFKPAILVRDIQLIRQIMIGDFGHFHDRGVYVDEAHDPMSANLFSLRGQTWRTLRAKLTPSFSSGKLKAMFETVDEVANKMVTYVDGMLKDGNLHTLEIKRLVTTYAIDIVGSVIFGLDIDSFTNPNNEFREINDRLFNGTNILRNLRVIMTFICPAVAQLLSRLGVNDPCTDSLKDIAQRTIEFREQHGVTRKDLLQLLIQLRNTGTISEDNEHLWSVETSAENLKSMSIDMIAANLCLFYLAGSETTAATATFTLYELAMNQDILDRAQKEVDQCLAKHNLKPGGQLTYEAIQDMKYLDLCIMETTRKYPAAPFLNRECTEDYRVPQTDFVIKKGTAVIIPLLAIHRDEQYFPSPMAYKPERFSEDEMSYNPEAFMPFGVGPRHCIAQRMGSMNTKVVLAKLLANFNIQAICSDEVEFKYHSAPVLVPKRELQVGLSRRW